MLPPHLRRRRNLLLAPEWQELQGRLADQWTRKTLSRFFHFCGEAGISPERVEGIGVGCYTDNAKGERDRNAVQAAILPRPELSGRRCPAVAAARSQRKSPEEPMCSQVSGEVWARSSSGTARPRARRCATASAT